MYELHDHPFSELSAWELHGLLRLRSEVFVVEQECVYLDIDGRDTALNVRHIWLSSDRRVVAAVRMFDEGLHRVIGRVVTAANHRGAGLAARLIDHCLATSDGPWLLDAQAHLEPWYEQLGFRRSGDTFIEDGIPHVPMTHPHSASAESRAASSSKPAPTRSASAAPRPPPSTSSTA